MISFIISKFKVMRKPQFYSSIDYRLPSCFTIVVELTPKYDKGYLLHWISGPDELESRNKNSN